jgi:8-oxo-dGTP pyrophosphatase MutT (NUDIX family)
MPLVEKKPADPTDSIRIPYTVAFCVSDDTVLLVRRVKPPFKDHYNGLGGKILNGESAHESVQRELLEEARFLTRAQVNRVQYKGIVAWRADPATMESSGAPWLGMHLFSLRIPGVVNGRRQLEMSEECALAWIPLSSLTWPMKVHAVPNLPVLIEEAFGVKRSPRLILLEPRGDGRFVAQCSPLDVGLSWPHLVDHLSTTYRLDEIAPSWSSSPDVESGQRAGTPI